MRAVMTKGKDTPWEVQEIEKPKPRENQVLLKVHASGICYTDVHQTKGDLPVNYPCILGHEPVGEIVELGPGVRSRKLGQRVGVPWVQAGCGSCEWCLRGKNAFCQKHFGTSAQMQGGHAEYMVVWADGTMQIPDTLTYEEAAPIFCAGYTVWSGLRIAKPQPAERVAVIGIGGLGHLALQYAAACGFHTIAVTHSDDKKKLSKELGANQVVADGRELMESGGADVILATSNSAKQTLECIKGLRPDGRFIVMGVYNEPFQINLMDLLFKRARIIGSIQNGVEYLYEALDIAAKGKIKVMTESFALDDAHSAYEKVEKGDVRFRAVLTP
ncbi:MAG: alcohol dehydrogenase catalytic domain-containing protein [Candidatus Obscuribacterales bacterium]|nr:alcohol dehydrogenase catalytic domain-containing protein [Candidatus Obscuribacterales bacterium]